MTGTRLEQGANYQWFAERLEDPGLLSRAVEVPLGRDQADIAVPVGDRRRGGYCEADPVAAAGAIAAMLARPADFPDLRWDYAEQRLVWGADPQEATAGLYDDAYVRAVGELYGYSPQAVGAFAASLASRGGAQ